MNALAQAFLTDAGRVPGDPLRYVLITPADIHIEGWRLYRAAQTSGR